MSKQLSLGNIAYNAYCESTEWKSVYTGAALPQYDQQRPEVIQAWENSALAVATTIYSTKSAVVGETSSVDYSYGVNTDADVPTTDLSMSKESVNTEVEQSGPDETYAIKA